MSLPYADGSVDWLFVFDIDDDVKSLNVVFANSLLLLLLLLLWWFCCSLNNKAAYTL